MKSRLLGVSLALVILLIASQPTMSTSSATSTPAPQDVDLTHLPLGDSKLSTSPRVGWIWPCQTDPSAGGAFRDGPWIHKDGTFDLTSKISVNGGVNWPEHHLDVTVQGDRRIISTNDLPDHATGIFPVGRTDAAYQYDRNPNHIATQNFQIVLPGNPTLADQPSCVPGAVGVLLTGSALFNALDGPGRDAVAHEIQDSCQGHPERTGSYHYHSLTNCLPDTTTPDGHSALMGYSLDGFGIYGRHGEGGKVLTSADLDECHGHTHEIEWDGNKIVMYHYHATWDFPYTIGCMRGTFQQAAVMAISGAPGGAAGGSQQGNSQPGNRPDLAAAAKKLGISEQKLRDTLGPPPPDFAAAAKKLGISEQKLRDALGVR
jgi:hypothetical protein